MIFFWQASRLLTAVVDAIMAAENIAVNGNNGRCSPTHEP
jgi:hypothetical protein